MKSIFLLILATIAGFICTAQEGNRYHFVTFSVIYQSGLKDKQSGCLLLKVKGDPDALNLPKLFLTLNRQKPAGYNEVLDTLAKTFEIYSMRFSRDSSGRAAEKLLDKAASYNQGFLIKLDEKRNGGPVAAFLINVFSPPVARISYRVLHSVCPYYREECTVEVSGLTLK